MEYMESKMQDHYEFGNALFEEIERLRAENEALAAQVGRTATFIKLSAKKWEGVSEVEPTFWNLLRVANEAPQQCLAEIKAEASRDGYLAGVDEWAMVCQGDEDACNHAANQYAAKIRKGEL